MAAAMTIDRRPCLLGPGLEDAALLLALVCFHQDPENQQSVIFGSRARGDARQDSDLDLPISDAATAVRAILMLALRHEPSLAASLDPAFSQIRQVRAELERQRAEWQGPLPPNG